MKKQLLIEVSVDSRKKLPFSLKSRKSTNNLFAQPIKRIDDGKTFYEAQLSHYKDCGISEATHYKIYCLLPNGEYVYMNLYKKDYFITVVNN